MCLCVYKVLIHLSVLHETVWFHLLLLHDHISALIIIYGSFTFQSKVFIKK